MAASVVAICNQALALLGADRITDLGDDSQPARLCSVFYEPARDAVLRAYPWNFAIRRAALAALTSTPAWGHDLEYQLPEGPTPEHCLRVLDVYLADERNEPWRVEGRKILTSLTAPLYISYVARITDPAQYDPLFVKALAARLAVELAYPITASSSMLDLVSRLYTQALNEARVTDAQESSPETVSATDWLDVRT